jgi:hypothetical protein
MTGNRFIKTALLLVTLLLVLCLAISASAATLEDLTPIPAVQSADGEFSYGWDAPPEGPEAAGRLTALILLSLAGRSSSSGFAAINAGNREK